jgi:hypothetical protein
MAAQLLLLLVFERLASINETALNIGCCATCSHRSRPQPLLPLLDCFRAQRFASVKDRPSHRHHLLSLAP